MKIEKEEKNFNKRLNNKLRDTDVYTFYLNCTHIYREGVLKRFFVFDSHAHIQFHKHTKRSACLTLGHTNFTPHRISHCNLFIMSCAIFFCLAHIMEKSKNNNNNIRWTPDNKLHFNLKRE